MTANVTSRDCNLNWSGIACDIACPRAYRGTSRELSCHGENATGAVVATRLLNPGVECIAVSPGEAPNDECQCRYKLAR